MAGHSDNRVNLSFSTIEMIFIKGIAKAVNKKVGTFCRDLILDTVGRENFELEKPEKGVVQINAFLPRPKTKSFKIQRKGKKS